MHQCLFFRLRSINTLQCLHLVFVIPSLFSLPITKCPQIGQYQRRSIQFPFAISPFSLHLFLVFLPANKRINSPVWVLYTQITILSREYQKLFSKIKRLNDSTEYRPLPYVNFTFAANAHRLIVLASIAFVMTKRRLRGQALEPYAARRELNCCPDSEQKE
jgi:hypothetical protein